MNWLKNIVYDKSISYIRSYDFDSNIFVYVISNKSICLNTCIYKCVLGNCHVNVSFISKYFNHIWVNCKSKHKCGVSTASKAFTYFRVSGSSSEIRSVTDVVMFLLVSARSTTVTLLLTDHDLEHQIRVQNQHRERANRNDPADQSLELAKSN